MSDKNIPSRCLTAYVGVRFAVWEKGTGLNGFEIGHTVLHDYRRHGHHTGCNLCAATSPEHRHCWMQLREHIVGFESIVIVLWMMYVYPLLHIWLL